MVQINFLGGYLSKGIHQTKMSVADYYKMTQDIRYATPQHEDYDDLEKKYWKGLNSGHPVYGCDVATAITDDGMYKIFFFTVSTQIGGRRLIKKLGFYGEILLNKMLSN